MFLLPVACHQNHRKTIIIKHGGKVEHGGNKLLVSASEALQCHPLWDEYTLDFHKRDPV